MTWLTWKDGPQMIGFTMMHVFPWIYILGLLGWLGLAGWLVVTIILRLRKFITLKIPDICLIGISIITLGALLIPETAWASVTDTILGLSPQADSYIVYAARRGDAFAVQKLLERGVSANSVDETGCSVLGAAANLNKPELISLLLAHKADPNSTCAGQPAIMNATDKNDLAAIKLLVAAGADANKKSKDGFTAYDSALVSNRQEIIKLFEAKPN